MPELPEVETVRRGLEPVLAGHRIVSADVRRPDLRWPLPIGLADSLTGADVLRLRRRSKYLLIDLSGDRTLIVHLGMSGRILISGQILGAFYHDHPAASPHDHVVLETESGTRITYNDARRFGAMDLVATHELEHHRLIAPIGPEPLGNDFNEAYLKSAFERRRSPVKAVLLDQRVVAGLGNIYVSEALYRAGISPRRLAANVPATKVTRLVPAVRDVLNEAIEAGGSSLRDYRQADGELGYFQHRFRVYDRAEAPCPSPECGGEIRRIVQSGRSSFYCPTCQR